MCIPYYIRVGLVRYFANRGLVYTAREAVTNYVEYHRNSSALQLAIPADTRKSTAEYTI